MAVAGAGLAAGVLMGGCTQQRTAGTGPLVGDQVQRRGDEIMVAGRLFHTGAPVVLWTDPGGYDAYRVEKRFGPLERSGWEAVAKEGRGPKEPARYNPRFFRFAEKQPEPWPGHKLSEQQIAKFRGGGWDLESLREVVDQFVLHYDVCGTAKVCFRVLHDARGLSVHFLLDIDGTIYQTLDVKERAWHATTSNDRSVGIEIANMGAYAVNEKDPLDKWYKKDANGRTVITIPPELGDGGVRTPGFVGRPRFDAPVLGVIQGVERRMYDLTPEQYDSLIKLTAALHVALPKIRLDYPRGEDGKVLPRKLPDEQLKAFTGVIGHYHIQEDKADPGPAFDWEYVVNGARELVAKRTARDGSGPGKPAKSQQ